jgi:hypothetical protein
MRWKTTVARALEQIYPLPPLVSETCHRLEPAVIENLSQSCRDDLFIVNDESRLFDILFALVVGHGKFSSGLSLAARAIPSVIPAPAAKPI